jgi:hypothetical protein
MNLDFNSHTLIWGTVNLMPGRSARPVKSWSMYSKTIYMPPLYLLPSTHSQNKNGKRKNEAGNYINYRNKIIQRQVMGIFF